jgi:hypothetical protein
MVVKMITKKDKEKMNKHYVRFALLYNRAMNENNYSEQEYYYQQIIKEIEHQKQLEKREVVK